MFEKMAKHISAATTVLNDASTATSEIDRVLAVMMYESRPVYIGVSTDIAYAPVSRQGLSTPIPTILPQDDASILKHTVTEIRSRFEQARKPVIIVDGCKFGFLQ
jgi:pyruvate decarboxylase